MRNALGKGLGALIKQSQFTPGVDTNVAVQKISISKIKPNRYQPRKRFNDESLRELAQSIKHHGLAQPIIVTKNPVNGDYELVAGERRLRASELAGLKQIDCIVKPKVSNENMLALALIENIQREDLNPIDTALAFKQLISQFGIAQKDVAEYCAKSKSTVSNLLRLLELEPEIQKSVQNSVISEGHARALLSIPNRNDRIKLFHTIVEKKLNVRQTEDLVRHVLQKGISSLKTVKKVSKSYEIVEFEKNLQQRLGTKTEVKANPKNNKGKIIIHYYSHEDLVRVSDKLLRGR
jgi:ParB family transcriptional regulator, chromosome partitioning protein